MNRFCRSEFLCLTCADRNSLGRAEKRRWTSFEERLSGEPTSGTATTGQSNCSLGCAVCASAWMNCVHAWILQQSSLLLLFLVHDAGDGGGGEQEKERKQVHTLRRRLFGVPSQLFCTVAAGLSTKSFCEKVHVVCSHQTEECAQSALYGCGMDTTTLSLPDAAAATCKTTTQQLTGSEECLC